MERKNLSELDKFIEKIVEDVKIIKRRKGHNELYWEEVTATTEIYTNDILEIISNEVGDILEKYWNTVFI